jgi:hypothetical protein
MIQILCSARSRWEDNIKVKPKEILVKRKGVDWIHQAYAVALAHFSSVELYIGMLVANIKQLMCF